MKKYLLLPLLFIQLHGNNCTHPLPDNKTLCNSHITPPCKLHFTVGLLLEQIRIPNTEVCMVSENSILDSSENASIPTLFSNQFANINFNLDVGLKLGLAYNFDHDDWMGQANFEWLNSRGAYNNTLLGGSSSLVPTNNAAIYYRIFLSLYPVDFQKVEAYLKVDYYLLDVYLSKGSFFSNNFSFEPFGGIKSSWIKYNSDQNFSDDSSTLEFAMPSEASWVRSTLIQFWGVGPMAGINANYHVVAGWSIFSSFQGSILLGERTLTTSQGFINGENSTKDVLSAESSIPILSPTISSTLGLEYTGLILDDAQYITLRVGFDGRVYFNQYPTVYFGSYESLTFISIYDENIAYPTFKPNFVANNPFGMIGCIIDLTWSF